MVLRQLFLNETRAEVYVQLQGKPFLVRRSIRDPSPVSFRHNVDAAQGKVYAHAAVRFGLCTVRDRIHRHSFSAQCDLSTHAQVTARKTATSNSAASSSITKKVAELGDWRGATLAKVRELIHAADAEVVEEWKWAKATSPGVPVWSHDGIICTGETYKAVVKLTFARGASLDDPKKLFNASLEGGTRRAIDIKEGESVNEAAFKKLIQSAVAANVAVAATRAKPKKAAPSAATAKAAPKQAAVKKAVPKKSTTATTAAKKAAPKKATAKKSSK